MEMLLGAIIEICLEDPEFANAGQKYGAINMKTSVHFIVSGEINSP